MSIKYFISFCLISVVSLSSYAQSLGINYQALILNTETINIIGDDLKEKTTPLSVSDVEFRFSIINSTGTTEYIEEHTTKTDENGMVSLVIGKGTPVLSNFSSIKWDQLQKRLYVEVKIIGVDDDFAFLDEKELLYVPSGIVTAINGVQSINGIIGLGGSLSKPTEIETDSNNTLALKGLTEESINSDLLANFDIVITEKSTGVLRKVSKDLFKVTIEVTIYTISVNGEKEFQTIHPITEISKIQVFRNGVNVNFSKGATNASIILEPSFDTYAGDKIKIIETFTRI